jgi:hypothetical protein
MVGGPRINSGRPADPNALRRDRKDDAGWTKLPAEGRPGDPPAWPLTEQTEREAHLWREFWAKPQGVLWEKNGQLYEVALHVRTFAEAEWPDAPVTLRTLVRQQADALLLTIPAMHSARVMIATDEVSGQRQARKAPATGRASARDRMKAIGGGASA